jgi:hypothetical protein
MLVQGHSEWRSTLPDTLLLGIHSDNFAVIVSRLRRQLLPKAQLINTAIFVLLPTNVLPYHHLTYANRGTCNPTSYGINYGQLSCRTSFMLNFERFTKVRFYILFPELSNSACLPGIAGGLPQLIKRLLPHNATLSAKIWWLFCPMAPLVD